MPLMPETNCSLRIQMLDCQTPLVQNNTAVSVNHQIHITIRVFMLPINCDMTEKHTNCYIVGKITGKLHHERALKKDNDRVSGLHPTHQNDVLPDEGGPLQHHNISVEQYVHI